MKTCEFCGKELPAIGNSYHRTVPGAGRSALCCADCAFSYDRRNAVLPDLKQRFLQWCEANADTMSADLKEPMRLLAEGVKTGLNQPAGTAEPRKPEFASMQPHVQQPAEIDSSRQIWITVCKVVAALCLIGCIIGGAVIGSQTDRTLGGLFLGLIAGVIAAAGLMLFANLCEDVAAIRAHLERNK